MRITKGLFIIGLCLVLAAGMAFAADKKLKAGFIYVGNDGRNNVEIFNPSGNRIRTIGDGVIQMPNSIKVGPDDNIYICDSKSDCVRVYDLQGKPVRIIGSGVLLFPSAIEIATIEISPGVFETALYVADQAHYQVKVFDLDGNLLRSFGSYAYKSMMGGLKWQGRFTSIEVFGILESQPVKNRFAISDADLETIEKWLRETHICWGIDGEHKKRLQLPPHKENTWQAGLDSIYAKGAARLYNVALARR